MRSSHLQAAGHAPDTARIFFSLCRGSTEAGARPSHFTPDLLEDNEVENRQSSAGPAGLEVLSSRAGEEEHQHVAESSRFGETPSLGCRPRAWGGDQQLLEKVGRGRRVLGVARGA